MASTNLLLEGEQAGTPADKKHLQVEEIHDVLLLVVYLLLHVIQTNMGIIFWSTKPTPTRQTRTKIKLKGLLVIGCEVFIKGLDDFSLAVSDT